MSAEQNDMYKQLQGAKQRMDPMQNTPLFFSSVYHRPSLVRAGSAPPAAGARARTVAVCPSAAVASLRQACRELRWRRTAAAAPACSCCGAAGCPSRCSSPLSSWGPRRRRRRGGDAPLAVGRRAAEAGVLRQHLPQPGDHQDEPMLLTNSRQYMVTICAMSLYHGVRFL